MKNILVFSIFVVLSLSHFACSTPGSLFYHEPHTITSHDARKLHPRSRLSDRHRKLNLEQAHEINRLHGENIVSEGDLIVYYEAKRRKGLYGDQGNVFLTRIETGTAPIELLVSVAEGKIYQLLLKEVPFIGRKPLVSNEFLFQFIGRSLEDSWEIVRSSEDLLHVPAKVRSMEELPVVSQAITNQIRKVLIFDHVFTAR
ncbi:MAG TPA: hypothetical protein VGB26_15080 [Nitrospiria bacterium]|jgi:hypothetical protein